MLSITANNHVMRPLDEIYAVVFMDAIHFHVRNEGQIIKNRHNHKTITSNYCEREIAVPPDRNGEYELRVLKKDRYICADLKKIFGVVNLDDTEYTQSVYDHPNPGVYPVKLAGEQQSGELLRSPLCCIILFLF